MRRIHVIACPSLQPELESLIAGSQDIASLIFLEMGLHQRSGPALRIALQAAIDKLVEGDAIAIGYGLCNLGIIGISARNLPLVIPRAYDCIGLLLGTRRYLAELAAQPGTFFQSAGWLANNHDVRQPDFTFGPASNVTRNRLVERYGEDNADYLLTELGSLTRHYDRLAYIATETSQMRESEAAAFARARSWTFDRLDGDTGWLRRLVSGDWDEREFAVIQPGKRVVAAYDGRLIDSA